MTAPKKKIFIRPSGQAARTPRAEKKPIRDFAPGDELGQGYVVDEIIARGGSGLVLKAHKPSISPPIYKAVKVINVRELDSQHDRDLVQEELYGEARISSLIGSDPYAISVEDIIDLKDGSRVLVCPFIDGRTLTDLIDDHCQRGQLMPVDLVAFIFHRSLSVLGHAQEREIPHRDLSLSNIMVQRTGVPMLIDWGSAAEVNDGVLIGKPGYMAQEVIKTPDAIAAQSAFKADIFSLAVVIRELLTGSNVLDYLPTTHEEYEAGAAMDFRKNLDMSTLKPLHEICPDIPKVLSDILDACLQENPDERPDSETLYDYVGQQYLYSSQVGFGITAETLKSYLEFFYSNTDPTSALPNDKQGRNLAKLITSKYRRLGEDPAHEQTLLADLAAQSGAHYINGSVYRSFAEAFGAVPLETAIRDTLIADIAKDYTGELSDPESSSTAEFDTRAAPIQTMDSATLRQTLAQVVKSESDKNGYDTTGRYYARVCHNVKGMSPFRGYLV